MANEKVCDTCGGDGYLIGDKADARGERTDDIQRCPDCNAEEDDGDDRETLDFERPPASFDCDDFIEQRLARLELLGGEA